MALQAEHLRFYPRTPTIWVCYNFPEYLSIGLSLTKINLQLRRRLAQATPKRLRPPQARRLL